jgi:hypothetical protein
MPGPCPAREGMGLDDGIPGRRPRRVGPLRILYLALEEGATGLDRWWRQALSIVISVTVGVGLAVAISGVIRGVERDVHAALPAGAVPPQIDLATINDTLDRGRVVLTGLAVAFSSAFVALVAWVAADKRRREIGIKRQYGLPWTEILVEVVFEGLFLCLVGSALGVALGYALGELVAVALPPLAADIAPSDVFVIIAAALAVNLLFIGTVYEIHARNPSGEQEL